jgi:hypothetical protein
MDGQEHECQADHLQLLNRRGKPLVAWLEGRLKFEAEQDLRAEDQHARFVQRVFNLVFAPGHPVSAWQSLCRR